MSKQQKSPAGQGEASGQAHSEATQSIPSVQEVHNASKSNPSTGEGYICDACGRGFTQAEWDDRHDNEDEEDRYYHAGCCPIYGDSVDTSAIIYGEVES